MSEQTNQNIYKAVSSVSESKMRGGRHCSRIRRDSCKQRRSIGAERFSLTTIEHLKYKTAEVLISGMNRQSELPRSPSPQSLFGNAVVMSQPTPFPSFNLFQIWFLISFCP